MEYLRRLEEKQKLPELDWTDRCVGIVGSDQNFNVGAYVGKNVAMAGGTVIEYEKYTLNPTKFEEQSKMMTDLVICAASVHMDWIEDITESDVYKVLFDSLMTPINCTSTFAETSMEAPHRKHIVFVGSMAHRQVLNASSIYCAAKAGLAHFARCAAWELTPKGFTIGTVHPGNIEGTGMTEDTIDGIAQYRGISLDEARAYWGSVKLTDKWLQPWEVADEVMRLLESTPHHSGCQIELAGGLR